MRAIIIITISFLVLCTTLIYINPFSKINLPKLLTFRTAVTNLSKYLILYALKALILPLLPTKTLLTYLCATTAKSLLGVY